MSELPLTQVYELRQEWLYELLPTVEQLAREWAQDSRREIRNLAADAEQLVIQLRSYLFNVSPTQDMFGERERRKAIGARLAALQAKMEKLAGVGKQTSSARCTYRGSSGPCTYRGPHSHNASPRTTAGVTR